MERNIGIKMAYIFIIFFFFLIYLYKDLWVDTVKNIYINDFKWIIDTIRYLREDDSTMMNIDLALFSSALIGSVSTTGWIVVVLLVFVFTFFIDFLVRYKNSKIDVDNS